MTTSRYGYTYFTQMECKKGDVKEAEMYKKAGMSSPIERGPIRGFMDYIPGGIPASEGFDYDKSLERFPEQMKGIERGNMPVFRTY